ncbi:MAG: PorT family protein [Thermoflavifilum sp.]|nr:PorT family protein [Thermoflavifilum sp.]
MKRVSFIRRQSLLSAMALYAVCFFALIQGQQAYGQQALSPNQTTPKASFGIKVGPNFSSVTTKLSGSKETSNLLTSVSGGIYVNLPLAPEFYLQPALLFEQKGGKKVYGSHSNEQFRLNYFTLPINFTFAPTVGTGQWLVGFGPYLGYGISGTHSGSFADSLITFSQDPFTGNNGLKRFDAGLDVMIGYQMASGIYLGVQTELGLVNLLKQGDSNNSFRNTSFQATIGYTFK